MNWKGCGKNGSRPNLMYYAVIFLMRLTTNKLGKDSRFSGLDPNGYLSGAC
jgi:hypothetical protein